MTPADLSRLRELVAGTSERVSMPQFLRRLAPHVADSFWRQSTLDYADWLDAALLSSLEGEQPPPRYRMTVDFVHHALSGHGGDPVVVPVVDPAGEWIRADPVTGETASPSEKG